MTFLLRCGYTPSFNFFFRFVLEHAFVTNSSTCISDGDLLHIVRVTIVHLHTRKS